MAFNQSIQKLEISAGNIVYSALSFFGGNQALEYIRSFDPVNLKADLEANRFFDFITFRNRSSLFQTQYPKAVRQQLSEQAHLPDVLTDIIRNIAGENILTAPSYFMIVSLVERVIKAIRTLSFLNYAKFISNNGMS